MQRDPFTKAMVVLQWALTAVSVIYLVNYGISKAQPKSFTDLLLVMFVYALAGLLASPIAGLAVASYLFYHAALLFKNSWFYTLLTKLCDIAEQNTITAIVMLLIFTALSIVLPLTVIILSFIPFQTFWKNLDYALYLLLRPFTALKRNKPELVQPITSQKTSSTTEARYSVEAQPRVRNLHAFDHLVGVDHAIRAIKDALEIPLMYPEKAREYGIKPSKGILFYGPPGTGKTSLARATAEYFGCYFISVKASELVGPYLGSSEAAVKQLFAQARANKPAIIFFDEIDAIGRRRDGSHLNRPSDIVLNILLAEMDGFERDEGVFVIGATNRLDVLDEALLRPGRFDSVIEIPLPDFEARKKLFSVYLKGRPISDEECLDVFELAKLTEGMSPAQIEAICKKAALTALKREIETGHGQGIRMSDLVAAVNEEKAQTRA
ncbi:ATP-dependent zinc metalloprotease FtsH [Fervidicola ferrireducens]|uniref:ATP-dependent zinc metalloprotease FtsH n=1 Tax=Fervidicola ferrireducens TaxID=520764 RepID=A0A140KZL5_9FIRM|nr:AAA family ATPase [Fervidicola ferrireducens]KXG73740.1 ATP-dependent zinc metalloprotease FtsH [Fervidicola ferrireducens]